MCGGPKKLEILSIYVIAMDLTAMHRAPVMVFRVATVSLSTTVVGGVNPFNNNGHPVQIGKRTVRLSRDHVHHQDYSYIRRSGGQESEGRNTSRHGPGGVEWTTGVRTAACPN